ncbi:CPBP family intramembrane metalloprotease [Lactobacillus sp. ESL0731]|uniref:CPBP family intramembrane glutamic endopeptidase n=1 Tax=unclassified Lactobacillus TaxID=2620435 RepID=UPI0023F9A021|nr:MULTISPECIES: CPBP family intramembrane glutamic endopeptidase [unclassified Lactobacillus]WEV51128.1 CPBP family intramembrane metalloprotease [Lactobacillus sp. ESL0700]WEV62257.1 CPBP family intramembrane metalloprotease [Lactobacillus sp. ESL0731]
MFSETTITKWHFCQTLFQLIILLVFLILGIAKSQHSSSASVIEIFFNFFFVCLQFTLLKKDQNSNSRLVQFNHYWESFTIALSLPNTLKILVKLFNEYHILNSTFWIALFTLYSLIMYIPMAELALYKTKNIWGRIFITFIMFLLLRSTPDKFIDAEKPAHWLLILNQSGFSGAIIFAIIMLIIMHDWGFQAPHLRISKRASKAIIGITFLFIIIRCLFNGFNVSESWTSILTSWDFYLAKSIAIPFFNSLEAGLAEEWLMRFCVLSLLLQYFENSHRQILWSVLCDGLIFGSIHITNLGAQSASATLQQMLFACCSGFVFAAIYLYSDSILISIGYHALFDAAAAVTTGALIMKSPSVFDWQETILLAIIDIIFAYFLISGSRKSTIIYNLKRRRLYL